MRPAVVTVFDSLSDKQRETLMLACRHLTSKEIALELGVAPVTIDKRIEAIRARLDNIPRNEVIGLFRQYHHGYDQTIYEPIILACDLLEPPRLAPQQDDLHLAFHDSLRLDARAPWSLGFNLLRPGLKPSDLGAIGKLMFMIAGALAIMMVAVLSMAFADALMRILAR
jgi:DNA-binding CsgD family transcriptional regulator